MPLFAMMPDRHAFDPREPGDQRRRVACLPFVELRSIDDARDDFAYVVRPARVGRNHAVQIGGIVFRWSRFAQILRDRFDVVGRRHDAARECERVRIVRSKMISDTR